MRRPLHPAQDGLGEAAGSKTGADLGEGHRQQ
jgi:hypothetical protein